MLINESHQVQEMDVDGEYDEQGIGFAPIILFSVF